MENYQVYVILAFSISVMFFIVFKGNKKVKEKSINIDDLVKLFVKEEVVNVEFIRNKIVITFKDITNFDVESLHGTYAKGITIVGDKIKFYVSDDIEKNKEVYNSIKMFIEG